MQNVMNGFPIIHYFYGLPTPQRYDDAIAMLILAPNCIG